LKICAKVSNRALTREFGNDWIVRMSIAANDVFPDARRLSAQLRLTTDMPKIAKRTAQG
jgi:hypothetical protein